MNYGQNQDSRVMKVRCSAKALLLYLWAVGEQRGRRLNGDQSVLFDVYTFQGQIKVHCELSQCKAA